jgi:mono/diheme cytochrome c family protein
MFADNFAQYVPYIDDDVKAPPSADRGLSRKSGSLRETRPEAAMRSFGKRISLSMIVLAIGSVMSSAQVADIDDNMVARGADLFMEHFAACHGDDATLGAPGDIRGLGRSTILSAMAGVEEMPSFGFLDDAETDALILWLDHARDE